jgi:hypothetical protein
MTTLLERAGASFLRAFLVTLLFLATGILNAPDQATAVALSIAALAAGIAAGIKAIQVLVPQISWATVVKNKLVAAWADAFTRAFVGVFLTFWAGWLAAPDWSTWKSALLAAVIGAATAGARALQGLLTVGESPAPNSGLT